MNWNALKNYKCPKCDRDLQKQFNKLGHSCTACGFYITPEKFDSIIVSLYKPKRFRTEEDNLSDLNNL